MNIIDLGIDVINNIISYIKDVYDLKQIYQTNKFFKKYIYDLLKYHYNINNNYFNKQFDINKLYIYLETYVSKNENKKLKEMVSYYNLRDGNTNKLFRLSCKNNKYKIIKFILFDMNKIYRIDIYFDVVINILSCNDNVIGELFSDELLPYFANYISTVDTIYSAIEKKVNIKILKYMLLDSNTNFYKKFKVRIKENLELIQIYFYIAFEKACELNMKKYVELLLSDEFINVYCKININAIDKFMFKEDLMKKERKEILDYLQSDEITKKFGKFII